MTFSVAARCARTGQMGVAVASHSLAVGAVVPWARAGVGAGAAQALTDPRYGRRLPELLATGLTPRLALKLAMTDDGSAALRQIGLVDVHGRTAGHTGGGCVAHAGWRAGAGVVAQGNMLAADGLWDLMADRFTGTPGELADRLLTALRAADKAGGDVRGRQAASLLVVDATPAGGVLLDLRVDDHPDPLAELERLLGLWRGDRLMRSSIDAMLAGGDPEPILADLDLAQQAFGAGNREPSFWRCLALAAADESLLDELVRENPGWGELYRSITSTVERTSCSKSVSPATSAGSGT
ncbi:DUF1028 domain-containing protein [Nonomuraea sp. NPDC059023]|uniref:DUF1028 domain-containing protein n=1 Tax=unclassified Nonomuraea TaxID=2593643 RepID=UPI00368D8641